MNSTATKVTLKECPLCHASETQSLFFKENQSYTQCVSCGLVYQDPLPSAEKNQEFYAKDYYASLEDREPFIQKARLNLYKNALRRCAPYRQTGRLLDIGSGYGDFLAMSGEDHWETWGIDPSSEACEKAESRVGKRVSNQTVESADFPRNHFDVITLWNVIDCMPDSVKVMQKIYGWLAPGGLLLIRTPNAFYHRWIYRFYSGLQAWLGRMGIQKDPSVFHLVNYEARTLKQLLSEAGFQKVRIRNGEPTQGDPYAHSPYVALVNLAKFLIYRLAALMGFFSGNRVFIGPTLMIEALKEAPPSTSPSLRFSIRIFLKKVVLHLLAVSGYLLGLPLWAKWLGRDREIKILLYHSVDAMKKGDMNVSPDQFKRQLDLLARYYSIISPEEMVDSIRRKGILSSRRLLITFDDGYGNNYRSAYPLLRDKKIKAIIFLLSGGQDSDRRVFHLSEDVPGENRLLQWDEVREMAHGGISFGSHGESHVRLKGLAAEVAVREIQSSKRKIESEMGEPIRFFSYPYGTSEDFDKETELLVEKAGYEAAFSAMFGTNDSQADLFSLKRIGIEASDTLFTFRAKLNGALGLLAILNLAPIRRTIRWFDRLFLKALPLNLTKTKFLLVSVDFPPHTDGVSSISRELSRRISKRGEEMLVIGPKDRGDKEFDASQPYRTFRVPGYNWGYLRFIPILVCMPWVVFRHNIRRVFAMNIAYGGILSWLLSLIRPLDYLIFAYGYEFEKIKTNPLARHLYLRIYRRAKKIVCCSARIREKLIGFGAPAEKTEVLYPAVDLNRYYPREVPHRYLAEKGLLNRRILLTVGRLIERKGHDQVLNVLPKIAQHSPDILYVIVGIGPHEMKLREQVHRLNLNREVRFMGKVSDEELSFLYNACEVFVMPSREIEEGGHIEGFGIVYLEANACGKPVIGGNSGGVSEAIRVGETGFLVDPSSPSEIAEKILYFLSHPEKARAMGEQGREWVRKTFDWERYSNQAFRLLSEGDSR